MHLKHILTAVDVLEHTGKMNANAALSSVKYKKPLIFGLTISQST